MNPRDTSPHSILGRWEYVDTAMKNTSVKGTIEFLANGTFIFSGDVTADYPTQPFERSYKFALKGNKLICLSSDYPATQAPPVSPYYFIQGDSLYFSNAPMKAVQDDWSGGYRKTNWDFKLTRLT